MFKKDGYAPNNLLPGEFGDYIELKIGPSGIVENWLSDADLSDFEEGGDD